MTGSGREYISCMGSLGVIYCHLVLQDLYMARVFPFRVTKSEGPKRLWHQDQGRGIGFVKT